MTLLDLVSSLRSLRLSGEGSFNEAVQVITGQENGFKYRRLLEGLGHIEIDRENGKINVLAPRLVALPRQNENQCLAVLAGARSDDLVSELEHLASARGISIERASLGEACPERITIMGPADGLKDLARAFASLPVEIANDPWTPDAWRLLCSVPSLQSIIEGFTQEPTGYANEEPPLSAEVFNPRTGYYDRWSRLRRDYESSYVLWRKDVYDYRMLWRQAGEQEEAGGGWTQRLSPLPIESYWVRWAVAYSAREDKALPPISGDGVFEVPKLTPLPMELHRVCCLCSGFPPSESTDSYTYRDVPPVIQQGVNDRLKINNP